MTEKSTKLSVQIGILLSFLGTLITNALANLLPINGYNTGDLSDNIPNLFVPAGVTFSIWGVIYILLTVFTGYFLRDWFDKSQREKKFDVPLGIAFIVSNLANIGWILLWHYLKIGLSLVLMLCILGSLIFAHEHLYKRIKTLNNAEIICLALPISIYLGWITVATVANVTAVAVVNNWGACGISESIWTILVLIVATGITCGMIWFRHNYAHALVILWAFLGILIKRQDVSNTPQPGIVITTYILMGIIVAIIAIRLFVKRKNRS